MLKVSFKVIWQFLTEIPFFTFNHSFDQKELIRFPQQVLSPSYATDDFMSKWISFRNRLIPCRLSPWMSLLDHRDI